MFNIYLDDGNLDINQVDDICYIINDQGTFIRKKIGITDALVKVNNISHLKSSILSFAKINIPPIPAEDVKKITKFFEWAYNEHDGESVVLIYYNPELEDFDIYPTDQEVSQASASYVKEGLSHTGYLLAGTIHSHANFGASHSGVDDNDELNFDGVHITIGNVNDTYQSISCSIVVNGNRFIYDAENYMEGLINVNTKDKDTTKQKFSKSDRYLVSELTFTTFPDEWKDKVQKRIKPYYKNKNKNSIFNSYLYKKHGYDIENQNGRLKNKDIITLEDNKHIKYDEEENNPCDNCIFRNHKSEKLVQEILDDDKMAYLFLDNIDNEEDDDDDDENFMLGGF